MHLFAEDNEVEEDVVRTVKLRENKKRAKGRIDEREREIEHFGSESFSRLEQHCLW